MSSIQRAICLVLPGGTVRYTAASIVDRVYDELKAMTVRYSVRPGERLNEIELSRRLGVSRTPLREALNRLSMEGFLRFIPGQGFYCRELNPKEIFDLFELRKAIETAAIRLSVHRAKAEEIESLESFLGDTGPEVGDRTNEQLVKLDETFHERLMRMSGNAEMLHVLHNVNARIRFVRWIDMDPAKRPITQKEHWAVLAALRQQNEQEAVGILDRHITRRLDQITSAIRAGIAHIYMGPASENTADLQPQSESRAL